jgi:hypothetical protein
MPVNLCVLRSGGDYKPEHVQRLATMVPDLVCLSDVPVDGVPCIPLLHDWPGWWAKLELCRPDIDGDVFYLDLDTTVYRMPRMPDRDTCLTDFGDGAVIGSGLLYLTEQTRQAMWATFTQDPQFHMLSHQKWPAGDQGFMLPFLRDAQRWQRIAKVYSYKIHCKKGVPHDAEIVCFHGKPRPWDLHEKTAGAT